MPCPPPNKQLKRMQFVLAKTADAQRKQKTLESVGIAGGKMKGYICGPRIYEYNGWLFEINAASGPWPLRKDGEPRRRAGDKFYDMFAEFDRLPKSKQETYRVGGGCVSI